MHATKSPSAPGWLAALAGWLLPGLGYVVVGERTRGMIAGGTILLLFLSGLLLGGIRTLDVPGYDETGQAILIATASGDRPLLRARPVAATLAKPWSIPQALVGPVALVGAVVSVRSADAGVPRSHARIYDIGTLYTAVAGMLNLLVILDAAGRSR